MLNYSYLIQAKICKKCSKMKSNLSNTKICVLCWLTRTAAVPCSNYKTNILQRKEQEKKKFHFYPYETHSGSHTIAAINSSHSEMNTLRFTHIIYFDHIVAHCWMTFGLVCFILHRVDCDTLTPQLENDRFCYLAIFRCKCTIEILCLWWNYMVVRWLFFLLFLFDVKITKYNWFFWLAHGSCVCVESSISLWYSFICDFSKRLMMIWRQLSNYEFDKRSNSLMFSKHFEIVLNFTERAKKNQLNIYRITCKYMILVLLLSDLIILFF